MTNDNLSVLLLKKIEEQVERAEHLTGKVPPDKIEWRPFPDALRICDLLGHLLECLAGFCATLYALNPNELAHFTRLREKPVNHCCSADEARVRMQEYLKSIGEGFQVLTDEQLSRALPTVFVSEGEPVLTLLLGNLEHFINHKYQLFFYLKLLGLQLGTEDLYKFRGPSLH